MTKEDLQQIAELIQQENAKLEQRMQQQIQGIRDEMETMMEDKIRGVKVLIENDIGKRIDALFDGYKLTHKNNGNWNIKWNC